MVTIGRPLVWAYLNQRCAWPPSRALHYISIANDQAFKHLGQARSKGKAPLFLVEK